MPIGDRSLSLLDDPEDRKKLQVFLNMVPRFLRTEIDELFVRIHPIPTIEVPSPSRHEFKIYPLVNVCFFLGVYVSYLL